MDEWEKSITSPIEGSMAAEAEALQEYIEESMASAAAKESSKAE